MKSKSFVVEKLIRYLKVDQKFLYACSFFVVFAVVAAAAKLLSRIPESYLFFDMVENIECWISHQNNGIYLESDTKYGATILQWLEFQNWAIYTSLLLSFCLNYSDAKIN